MKVGILVMGSLLWDRENGRPDWRARRLEIDAGVRVRAAVRYWRVSQRRGNSYTMALAPAATNCRGQAAILTCRSPVTSVEALIEEAQALWRAEDPAWLPSGLIGGRGGWGTVGVLANPEINEAVSLQWQWIERVRAGGLLVRTDRHVPLTDGAIEMAWPRSDVAGNSLEVCLILAAVNRVDPPPPTPFAIADAWIANSCRADSSEAGVIRSENYFFQNIANGLRTDDDGQIWARMCSKHAPFLGDDAYRAPVERLSREFGAPERFQRA